MNFLAIALFQWHCILWVTILLVTLHCWWRWVRCCSFIIKLYLEAPCLWSWVRPHGIWKEICPVGAPNCRLVDFLRLEEFVILEISLWDQFGFKYGSSTMLWHNDTTWWCNYTPCNHQVHLNLSVDQLLVGLFCSRAAGCLFVLHTEENWTIVVWTKFCLGAALLPAIWRLVSPFSTTTPHGQVCCQWAETFKHIHWQCGRRAALHWLHWTLVMNWYTSPCAWYY